MAPDVTVRREEPGDEPGIRAVHLASFATTGEARLVDALRAAGRLSVSLVAVDRQPHAGQSDSAVNDPIVGHVGFSPVSADGIAGGVGLAPVAVVREHRRRGIAAQLIRDGLDACAAMGCRFVVVLGEPHYYSRFGFVAASRWGLRDEYGGGAAFQALELLSKSLPGGERLIRYAPEFASLSEA